MLYHTHTHKNAPYISRICPIHTWHWHLYWRKCIYKYCLRLNQIPLINSIPMKFTQFVVRDRCCRCAQCVIYIYILYVLRKHFFLRVNLHMRSLLLRWQYFQLIWIECVYAVLCPIWKIIRNFIEFQPINLIHEICNFFYAWNVYLFITRSFILSSFFSFFPFVG